ncbi:MAG TPA: SDR family oxidoreductase [Longimicrobiales bacterium]|nr:SDR family oxidoreductase [Longimicrobiales bacterium]
MEARQVAIVTAAGKGIGAACATELAARGYAVALMSRSDEAEALARRLGGVGVVGDVTRPADLERLVAATLDAYGRVDAVVNNTGHPAKGELLEISDEDWHQGLDLLVLSVVRLARLVTPVMARQGGGAIVNISSFVAVEPGIGRPVSAAMRAALGAVTKEYADRYATAGIRMNSVLPGFVDSHPVGDDVLASIPMGRAGTLAELARTVAFLLSPDAAYITGQSVRMDGGLTRSI